MESSFKIEANLKRSRSYNMLQRLWKYYVKSHLEYITIKIHTMLCFEKALTRSPFCFTQQHTLFNICIMFGAANNILFLFLYTITIMVNGKWIAVILRCSNQWPLRVLYNITLHSPFQTHIHPFIHTFTHSHRRCVNLARRQLACREK